jgi:glycosyltransferase involved in cell wall biosynthesis
MEKKKIILSIALAVKNEESNIKSCLSSVRDIADEIIVVDGGSTDRTVEYAKKYGAKVIRTDNPPIFHINKQKALDACHGTWILQLDADEVVTEELKKEIKEIVIHELRTTNQEPINDYSIPRKNYFLGKWLRKGGQYPDYVIRLIKKGKAYFPCKSVHEQIKVSGNVGYLHNPLLHYSYKTISEYWMKADTYTTLTVGELQGKRVKKGLNSWFTYNFTKPVYTFWTIFLRHKGFTDGYRGFLFAFFSALHHPIAWRKYTKSVKPACRQAGI